jgi:hypothetical protein
VVLVCSEAGHRPGEDENYVNHSTYYSKFRYIPTSLQKSTPGYLLLGCDLLIQKLSEAVNLCSLRTYFIIPPIISFKGPSSKS